jgi:hypothetical protein
MQLTTGLTISGIDRAVSTNGKIQVIAIGTEDGGDGEEEEFYCTFPALRARGVDIQRLRTDAAAGREEEARVYVEGLLKASWPSAQVRVSRLSDDYPIQNKILMFEPAH